MDIINAILNWLPPSYRADLLAFYGSSFVQGIKITDVAIAIFACMQLIIYEKQTKIMSNQAKIVLRQSELAAQELILKHVPMIKVNSIRLWRFKRLRATFFVLSIKNDGLFPVRLTDYGISLGAEPHENYETLDTSIMVPKDTLSRLKRGCSEGIDFATGVAIRLINLRRLPPHTEQTIKIMARGRFSLEQMINLGDGNLTLVASGFINYEVRDANINFSRLFDAKMKFPEVVFDITYPDEGFFGSERLPEK